MHSNESYKLFAVMCTRFQFEHAEKVIKATRERVYLLDTSGFFEDATDAVVEGTRIKQKGGFSAVLSATAQLLYAKDPESYLGLHTVVLSIDNIGVYLPESAAGVFDLGPFRHSLQGPALCTTGMLSVRGFFPGDVADRIVATVEKSAEGVRLLEGDDSWQSSYIGTMWELFKQPAAK